jgi:hypothetical protein
MIIKKITAKVRKTSDLDNTVFYYTQHRHKRPRCRRKRCGSMLALYRILVPCTRKTLVCVLNFESPN